MINKELFFSTRQCGKTQMMINWFEEMQKHLNNKDDFISFIEKFDKVLTELLVMDLRNMLKNEMEVQVGL